MVAMPPAALSTPVRRALAAAGGGVLGAFSLPPWGWWPLGIAGLALYAFALAGASRRSRAWSGAAFGLGMFSIGLWWITEFHAVGYVALLALEISFFVAAAMTTTRLVVFPAAVVLAEAARGAVPFGGLPLGGLALGQAESPLVASSRIGGALLVLALAAAIGSGVVALARTSTHRAGAALIAVAVVVAAVGWIAPAGSPTSDDPIDAVVVQGGGRRGFRAVESDPGDVLDAHVRASDDIDGPVDLVVWPENAIDVDAIDDSDAGQLLAAIAQETGATVVAGVTQDAGIDGFENTAVVWTPDGEITDRYTKVRRVPFGEYVPMRALIERLADLSVLPRDAVAGRGPGIVLTPAGPLAVAISYEVFFSDRARSGVRAGGEVLLVPTNAASFTTSQVPTQEVAAAQLRAWETGRWVLQAAPTGYSAVIDERGRVRHRSVLGEAQLLSDEVPRRDGQTIYMRLGDVPLLVVAAAALLLGVGRMRGFRGD